MKSPKQRFLEAKLTAESHRNTVDSAPFALAMDAALMQLVWDMEATDDPAKAAASHWKLMGAVSYMKKLESIGSSTPDKAKPTDGNLDHNA